MHPAPHHLGDIVQAEPGTLAQFGDQDLILGRGRLAEMMADMAAILGRPAPPLAPDRGLRDPVAPGEHRHRLLRGLDLRHASEAWSWHWHAGEPSSQHPHLAQNKNTTFDTEGVQPI